MSFEGLSPLAFESVSAVTATNTVELGTRRTVGGRDYLYVYNGGNSQIPPTYGAVLLSGASGYSVSISSVAGTDQLIGVVRNTTLTTATYGWVMVRGHTPVEMHADASAAVSDLLTIGANGTFDKKISSAGTDLVVGPTYGKALEAAASAASGNAYITAFG